MEKELLLGNGLSAIIDPDVPEIIKITKAHSMVQGYSSAKQTFYIQKKQIRQLCEFVDYKEPNWKERYDKLYERLLDEISPGRSK